MAELTSLEELMRTLYEDGRVDADVVSTLWQVYSMCVTGLCLLTFTENLPCARCGPRNPQIPAPRGHHRPWDVCIVEK